MGRRKGKEYSCEICYIRQILLLDFTEVFPYISLPLQSLISLGTFQM